MLYIYVRTRTSGEHSFRKNDWLHFIPAAFAFADLFPYYFLTSIEFKGLEMAEYARNPMVVVSIGKGFLPASFHYWARAIHGVAYVIGHWWVLFARTTVDKELDKDKEGTRWFLY